MPACHCRMVALILLSLLPALQLKPLAHQDVGGTETVALGDRVLGPQVVHDLQDSLLERGHMLAQ